MKEIRKIYFEDAELEYTLERKQVRNVNLRIYGNGTIYVSANPSIPLDVIEEFVSSKREMIEKSMRKFANKIIGNGLRNYVTGEVLYVLGTPRTLLVEEGWNEQVVLTEDTLKLVVRDADDSKHKERKIKAWRKEKQREILLPVCEKVYPMFAAYHLDYPEIVIKEMSSRWGVCMPGRKRITLNGALIETPEKCIEYVVVHEFSHFIEPNHSKDFYRVVASVMPDYRRRERTLEQYSCRS